MNETKPALRVLTANSELLTRITRHKVTLTFFIPTVKPTDEVVTIQVFYDRNNGVENADVGSGVGDDIFQIILGDEPLEKTPGNQVICQPVASDDDFQPETLGSLLNEALADWLVAGAKAGNPIIGGDWDEWFDELCAEIKKQTGVNNAF